MIGGKSQKNRSKEVPQSFATDLALRRPEVIVEFIFESGLLFICVRNIGERPATKVSVQFDKEITGLNGTKNISALESCAAKRSQLTGVYSNVINLALV